MISAYEKKGRWRRDPLDRSEAAQVEDEAYDQMSTS